MKKLIISGIAAMTIFAISCNSNEQNSVQPITKAASGLAGARGGTGGGTGGGGSTNSGGINDIATPVGVDPAVGITAPTTVLTYTGILPFPSPSATNNPITDGGATLGSTPTWFIKFTVNGSAVNTYANMPFTFTDPRGTFGSWRTSTADPHGGRNPVGFWYSYSYLGSSGIGITYCSIDKSFQALVGWYSVNPASTENNIILDRSGADGHITFYR